MADEPNTPSSTPGPSGIPTAEPGDETAAAGGSDVPSRFSRRRLLAGLGVLGGLAALGGAAFGIDEWVTGGDAPQTGSGGVSAYRSRPDLHPQAVTVTVPADDVGPGYVLLAPSSGAGQYGPMILDNKGQPVWFKPVSGPWPPGSNGIGKLVATNFRVDEYRGQPVLSWWEGEIILPGYGQGRYHVLDQSYRTVATVEAGNGKHGDLHEFIISPTNTALCTYYEKVPANLSSVGGPAKGTLLDCGFQEIDIDSGRVLFEWNARDVIAFDESYNTTAGTGTSDNPWDFFHINSIDVDTDGNFLISARHTWAVYKIDRTSGAVIWRLNGKQSDYHLGRGARFAWQHDARRNPDGTISIFDDGAGVFTTSGKSRGILLAVDDAAMTAELAEEYIQPGPILASSQGSVQMQPNGNAFVGWGSQPYASEFSHDGRLLFDLQLAKDGVSYRAFRFPWSGRPTDRPALAVSPAGASRWTAHASWNGATDVDSWQVLSGPSADRLRPVARTPRSGFETAVTWTAAGSGDQVVAVAALDAHGTVLARSAPRSIAS